MKHSILISIFAVAFLGCGGSDRDRVPVVDGGIVADATELDSGDTVSVDSGTDASIVDSGSDGGCFGLPPPINECEEHSDCEFDERCRQEFDACHYKTCGTVATCGGYGRSIGRPWIEEQGIVGVPCYPEERHCYCNEPEADPERLGTATECRTYTVDGGTISVCRVP